MEILVSFCLWLTSLLVIAVVSRKYPTLLPSALLRPSAPGLLTIAFVCTINLLNQCVPGWCGTYGYPFVYHNWSDALILVDFADGLSTSDAINWGAAAGDALAGVVLVLLAQILAAGYRRHLPSPN